MNNWDFLLAISEMFVDWKNEKTCTRNFIPKMNMVPGVDW